MSAATLPPSVAEEQALERFESRIRALGEPRARLERLQLVAAGGERVERVNLPQLPGWAFVALLAAWGLVAAVGFGGCR